MAPRTNVFAETFSVERGDLRLERVAIVEYPEQGTVRVLTRSPWAPPDPNQDPADRLALLFDRSDAKEDRPAS